MLTGPVVCMVWEGKNAFAVGRQLLGATKPSDSAPGTIRFGKSRAPGAPNVLPAARALTAQRSSCFPSQCHSDPALLLLHCRLRRGCRPQPLPRLGLEGERAGGDRALVPRGPEQVDLARCRLGVRVNGFNAIDRGSVGGGGGRGLLGMTRRHILATSAPLGGGRLTRRLSEAAALSPRPKLW